MYSSAFGHLLIVSLLVPPTIETRRAIRRIQLQRVRNTEDARCLQGEQGCPGLEKAAGADPGGTEGVGNAEGTTVLIPEIANVRDILSSATPPEDTMESSSSNLRHFSNELCRANRQALTDSTETNRCQSVLPA